jgi:hypothetical protein
VAADGSGNVYVADVLNHRIQKWAPGAAAGVTVAGGNGAGSRADQLYLPYGVAVDRSGNVYVADVGNHRIQRWTPGAPPGVTVAGSKGDGGNADQFNYPFGLATDGRGNLYVADMLNHRVQQFSPTLDAAYTPAEAGAYSATVTTFSGCAAEAAPVAVTEAVAITAQPEGAAKCAGESVGMSVAATGVYQRMQYGKVFTKVFYLISSFDRLASFHFSNKDMRVVRLQCRPANLLGLALNLGVRAFCPQAG